MPQNPQNQQNDGGILKFLQQLLMGRPQPNQQTPPWMTPGINPNLPHPTQGTGIGTGAPPMGGMPQGGGMPQMGGMSPPPQMQQPNLLEALAQLGLTMGTKAGAGGAGFGQQMQLGREQQYNQQLQNYKLMMEQMQQQTQREQWKSQEARSRESLRQGEDRMGIDRMKIDIESQKTEAERKRNLTREAEDDLLNTLKVLDPDSPGALDTAALEASNAADRIDPNDAALRERLVKRSQNIMRAMKRAKPPVEKPEKDKLSEAERILGRGLSDSERQRLAGVSPPASTLKSDVDKRPSLGELRELAQRLASARTIRPNTLFEGVSPEAQSQYSSEIQANVDKIYQDLVRTYYPDAVSPAKPQQEPQRLPPSEGEIADIEKQAKEVVSQLSGRGMGRRQIIEWASNAYKAGEISKEERNYIAKIAAVLEK
uniref:Uncharacterized protein n=1 Tax=viral metagenome TaxID=1070528 RepID=A0A6M3L4Y2_9ZZZZ